MSKNKDYRKFYNKPKKEETVNEPVPEEIKEVQAIEETAETPQEETPIEEQKVEDIYVTKVGPNSVTQEPIVKLAKVAGTKRVNMRYDASKDAPVLTVLSEGETVRIIEKSSDGVWSRIQYNDRYGFMMTQFLKEI